MKFVFAVIVLATVTMAAVVVVSTDIDWRSWIEKETACEQLDELCSMVSNSNPGRAFKCSILGIQMLGTKRTEEMCEVCLEALED